MHQHGYQLAIGMPTFIEIQAILENSLKIVKHVEMNDYTTFTYLYNTFIVAKYEKLLFYSCINYELLFMMNFAEDVKRIFPFPFNSK